MSCIISFRQQTYNSDSIVGTPIRIGNLEVAQNDFPNQMNWSEAKRACIELGSGWRLPTIDELNLICKNKDKIGGFAINSFIYWSSMEDGSVIAWRKQISKGVPFKISKSSGLSVRAVRTIN